MVARRFVEARREFYSAFSVEIGHIRAFMNEYPFLTLGAVFFCGLIVGGILRATVSQFVIITLLGGFSLAIIYGSSLGLPTWLSSFLVVPIDLFVTYAALRGLRAFEDYPKAAPYLVKLKSRYEPGSRIVVAHAGKIGLGGTLAIATFLVGWWITVAIAYLLDVDIATTMKSTLLALLISAGVTWATYDGLMMALPNPILVTAITIAIFTVLTRIIVRGAKRAATGTTSVA